MEKIPISYAEIILDEGIEIAKINCSSDLLFQTLSDKRLEKQFSRRVKAHGGSSVLFENIIEIVMDKNFKIIKQIHFFENFKGKIKNTSIGIGSTVFDVKSQFGDFGYDDDILWSKSMKNTIFTFDEDLTSSSITKDNFYSSKMEMISIGNV